ncbi:MAG: ABC transporter permease subunit [Candidatus Hodarchaeales archaeon]|jgi:ABC-type transport system involved in multi-copper enzyme maturation permease subunit
MLNIYTKQLRKNWFSWSLVSILMATFSLFMVLIWPSFEPYVEMLQEMLELPFYQAILGEGLSLTSLEGLLSMELFILSDIFFMGLILLFGIQCIPREVDSGSLDFMLSFPVPRWRFLLEKLAAFITVTLSYPILTAAGAILGVVVIGVEFQSNGLEAFFLGLFGRWVLYVTLTCLIILLSIIFMDTGKTLTFGGLLLGGSWLIDTLGGLVIMADATMGELIQGMSLYYYLDGPGIMGKILGEGLSGFPLGEFVLILAIGVGAIVLSLAIFDNPIRQKREFK